jgi:WD40 repeat protein
LAIDRLRAERRNAYATVIQRAEDYWQESPPNILRARELLASLVPRENDEDLRGVEWYLLSRMCNADEERMLHGAGTIKELAVRADGRALAFRETGFNPYLEWIDADGKAGRQSIRGEALPALMRFSKQSDWVATRSAGGRIELRNRLTPEKVEAEVQAKSEELAEIAISDDGQWIAWCTWPGQYGLWNVATRQLEFEDQLSKVDVAIRRILISPDGNWLAMFGIRDVYFVNRQKRQQSYQVHSNSSSNITALAFASDSKLFAISHNDGEIQTFAVPPQRTALRRFNTLKLTVRPESLEFLPSGDLAVGASNGLLIVMDVKEGKTRTFRGHTETISCLAASPDGRWLYSGSLRGEVLRWDPSLTDQRATLIAGAKKPTDEMMAYYCADYSPDGRWLAVGGQWLTFDDAPASGEIVLADASTGKIVRRIATPQGVAACRFTIDGKGLIYGTARALTPGQFWLAEMPALDRPREIALSGRKLFAAAPLADGNIALASGDATVRLWSPKTGAEVGQWQPAATRGPHQATEMFSIIAAKGGHHALAHGEGGLVRLWESPGGRDVLVAPATIGHEPLAISSDGRLVAWPAANPDIRQSLAYEGVTIAPGIPWYSDWEERAIVYDSQQQQMRMGVLGHSRGLTAMAFSADSRRLAAGDGRGEVKLWDTETGYELLTFDAHTNDVFAIAFHPSGRQMATVGADGLVRIWPRK